jgi:hypothetical protein
VLTIEPVERAIGVINAPASKPVLQQSEDDTESLSSDDDLLDEYEDETTAQASLRSIMDCNDHLFKLAIEIRNPSTRVSMSKALRYRLIDHETKVDLFDQYAALQIDRQHVESVISHLSTHPAAPEERCQYLVDRMAKANVLRSRQFGYWRHHHSKLLRGVPDAQLDVAQVIDRVTNMHLSGGEARSEQSKPTTATNLPLSQLRTVYDSDVQSVASAMTVQPSDGLHVERLQYPEPPSLERTDPHKTTTAKEFSCPYCFIICPARLAGKHNWEYVWTNVRARPTG